jgi:hypothetical protein
MRIRFALDDGVLILAVAALVYFRNLWAIGFLVLAVAYSVYRYYKAKKSEPPVIVEDNEFVIEDKDETIYTAEVDIGLDYRPMPNHFRTDYRHDTSQSKSLYEYRLEATDVSCRLIYDEYEDMGVPEQRDVRDGVVMESEIRKRDESRSARLRSLSNVEDKITSLKKAVEWQKMEPLAFHGLKYFILAKKLPQADARRYLRQELERLKSGETGFFREAEKYGLEPDESSLDRLKLMEGKSELSTEDWKKLFASAQTHGISDVEFSWGKKLKGVLEKLLGN